MCLLFYDINIFYIYSSYLILLFNIKNIVHSISYHITYMWLWLYNNWYRYNIVYFYYLKHYIYLDLEILSYSQSVFSNILISDILHFALLSLLMSLGTFVFLYNDLITYALNNKISACDVQTSSKNPVKWPFINAFYKQLFEKVAKT